MLSLTATTWFCCQMLTSFFAVTFDMKCLFWGFHWIFISLFFFLLLGTQNIIYFVLEGNWKDFYWMKSINKWHIFCYGSICRFFFCSFVTVFKKSVSIFFVTTNYCILKCNYWYFSLITNMTTFFLHYNNIDFSIYRFL